MHIFFFEGGGVCLYYLVLYHILHTYNVNMGAVPLNLYTCRKGYYFGKKNMTMKQAVLAVELTGWII